jgi:U3 small nucleolar RNA-associated protein 12
VYRKFELSKAFGLVTSASSNAVWAKGEKTLDSASHTGSGRAIVGAGEEVLCWDIKKGELLSKWLDPDCKAQVTAIARSGVDEDIFAVG